MKKLFLAINIVLCVIFCIVPILELVGAFVETEFLLYSELVVSIVQAILSGGALFAYFYLKPRHLDELEQAFGIWALPISMLNAFCFIVSGLSFAWIGAIAASVCVFLIYLKFIKDSTQRAVAAVVSVILCFAIGFVTVWNLALPIFSSKKVLLEIESNDGEYIAELATTKSLFGKKTVIDIRRSEPETNLLIGGYFKEEKRVYEGEEYVALNAKISWSEVNDDMIIVNGTEISIDFE